MIMLSPKQQLSYSKSLQISASAPISNIRSNHCNVRTCLAQRKKAYPNSEALSHEAYFIQVNALLVFRRVTLQGPNCVRSEDHASRLGSDPRIHP